MPASRSVGSASPSRIPARTYSVSALIRRALAMSLRILADGWRSPRSIWDR